MNENTIDEARLEEVIDHEVGARHATGISAYIVIALCLGWALFQLSIAGIITLDALRSRVVHLAFAMALAFLVFPARKKSPRSYIPWYDWLLATTAVIAVMYLVYDYKEIQSRPGAPIFIDLLFGGVGMILLLEATRRALGPALTIVAGVFMTYSFLGPILPDIIGHRGYSLRRVIDHQFLTTEGIFGVPLGVSTAYVFLFVLFGAMLERAGAGKYFIDVAYSLLGRFRGGPAKAAILASGFTGMVNGSSIANTVTTGTFTIPLMKKVGYPPEKAAAIEVAASTDGQLMPPIMGAAAFIIAEFLGISYFEVVKAAFIPAVASYLTLFYISHLEALKLGIKPTPKDEIPKFWPTFTSGLHFLIPVIALVYSLLILRQSPIASVFTAILILMTIMVIQAPLMAMRKGESVKHAFLTVFTSIFNGLVGGSRNMVAIAVATAVAGIIVGTVTLTGFGLRIVEVVELLSMGSFALMLFITAIACLLLGMGLPTTATYIVMATLTAPVIVTLGEDAGFAVPLIAAHLFVFYFGILADDTPPVGLCAYAGAAIAGADPIKTGLQSFVYDLRGSILPFMFIINTEILLIGVDSVPRGIMVFVMTVLGMWAFTSALQGHAISRLNWGERLILLVVTFLMLNPVLFNFYYTLADPYFYAFLGLLVFGVIIARQWFGM
ncbi:TRAP-type uncharacterized transport system, fused permease component, partial [hydrothermal vent metagenome]